MQKGLVSTDNIDTSPLYFCIHLPSLTILSTFGNYNVTAYLMYNIRVSGAHYNDMDTSNCLIYIDYPLYGKRI